MINQATTPISSDKYEVQNYPRGFLTYNPMVNVLNKVPCQRSHHHAAGQSIATWGTKLADNLVHILTLQFITLLKM